MSWTPESPLAMNSANRKSSAAAADSVAESVPLLQITLSVFGANPGQTSIAWSSPSDSTIDRGSLVEAAIRELRAESVRLKQN